MDKEWYVEWHKRLSASSLQRLFWRFLGIHLVYIYVVGGILLLVLPQYRLVGMAGLLAVVVGWGVVQAVRLIMPKKRPYQAYGLAVSPGGLFFSIHRDASSFPSGHAAALAGLSVVLLYASLTLGVFSFCVVLLNGLARVVLGYHYWSDVVAGILLGIAGGALAVVVV